MKQEKELLSGMHLALSVACFMVGSTLLSAFILGISKQDSWFAIVLGFVAILPILAIYFALVRMFPGDNLVQMSQKVFGPVIGKLFSLLFILFFFSLTFLNSRDMSGFVVERILPGTPVLAVLIPFLFVCAYAVRKGIQVIAGFSGFFLITTISVLLIYLVLLGKDFKSVNFLPVLQTSPIRMVQGTHIVTIIPFGETMAFLMIVPKLKNTRETMRSWLTGAAVGGAYLLVIILRDTGVLGVVASAVILPSFEAVRLIQVADVLTRMEVLYAFSLIMSLFFKITILYYATVVGLKHVFGLRSYRPLVFPVGILVILFSMIAFESGMENAAWGSNVAPFYSAFFEVVLPLLLLIFAKIRFLKRKIRKGVSRV